MKQLDIPFRLGMQYDNWEFELEVTQDRLQGCDSYIYIGKGFNKFLNYTTHKTELLFSLDILEAIIISLATTDYKKICNLIGLVLINTYETKKYSNIKICEFSNSLNNVYCVGTRNNIFVIICNPRIISSITNTLLW